MVNCSGCGSVKKDLSLSERTYTCDHCGLVIDRDVNAAINILNNGEDILKPTEKRTQEEDKTTVYGGISVDGVNEYLGSGF